MAGRGIFQAQLSELAKASQALSFSKCHPDIERHLFQKETSKILFSTLSNR